MWVKQAKKIQLEWALMLIFILAGLAAAGSTVAENLNFSQSILPVRFVYLDNQNTIQRIWSNISPTDNLYMVKFINVKTQTEMGFSENVFNSYQDIMRKSNSVSGLIVPSAVIASPAQNNFYNLAIDFIKTENSFEEVHTFS